MTTTPASEAFDTAIEIEQVGKEFYETLAIACDDRKVSEFCKTLARQEAAHMVVFSRLRKQFHQPAARPDPDACPPLTELARKQIMPDPAAVHRAAVGGKLPDALAMAMEMERDSIRFYTELAAQVPEAATEIRAIIDEERHHLAQLHTMIV